MEKLNAIISLALLAYKKALYTNQKCEENIIKNGLFALLPAVVLDSQEILNHHALVSLTQHKRVYSYEQLINITIRKQHRINTRGQDYLSANESSHV